tara:strand:- start:508 stop:1374 length:867 start_codon:yes stop_codon:yes gene_type:complete
MPELPEVEVVKRSLQSFIKGRKIKKITILNRKLRYKIKKNFENDIKNQKIIFTKRRSKFLLLGLEKRNIILIHLGMTGKLFIFNQSSKKLLKTSFYYENKIDKKHNHLIFKFNRNISLIYNDVRKFGFIKLISLRNFKKNNHLIHLGPEPLNKEFNIIYLMKKIRNIKKNVKNFLMDQKNVAGLGNIYVNEILHTSSINPRKISKNLKLDEIKKIIKNTKIILKKAIFLGGSSIRDFKGISGNTGNFQQKFKVYGRDGQLCRKSGCKGIIKKIYISNRSTFHCIRCQK